MLWRGKRFILPLLSLLLILGEGQYRTWRSLAQIAADAERFSEPARDEFADLKRRLSGRSVTIRTALDRSVVATAEHPGLAATNLLKTDGRRVRRFAQEAATKLLAQNDEDGALPTLYAMAMAMAMAMAVAAAAANGPG